jgi:hypothetical protein
MVAPSPLALDALLAATEDETRAFAGLLRLAHRQRRYMVRQDVRRLATVAEAIAARVLRAREVAARRQAALQEIAAGLGRPPHEIELQQLAPGAENPQRVRLEAALRRLSEVGGRLYRANTQNHLLARFSLDLLAEQQRLVLGETGAAGHYDCSGAATRPAARGAIDGRA